MNNLWRLDGVELWQLAGWTMLHFLWIGAAVAVVAGVSRLVLRGTSPAVRYAAALGCLVALAAAPAGIAAWLALQSPAVPVANQTAIPNMPVQLLANAAQQVAGPDLNLPTYSVPLAPGASEQPADERPLGATGYASAVSENPGITGGASGTAILVGNIFEYAVPLLPWLWIVGAPITFVLLATGVVGADRLRRASGPINDGPIVDACRQLRESLRITREVAVAVCERIAAPVLVGIVRPVILLPPSALTGWSPDEIEMVLLHELAHVRRWDNLVNLAQRLVESLLFFHPAVWWISSWVRHEREECCDRVVVGRTNRPHAYAEMLVALAAQMPRSVLFHPTASSAMAAGPLRNRIRRILQLEEDPMLISGKSLVLVTAGLLIVATLTVLYLPARGNAEQSDDGLDEKSITIEVTNKDDGEQETYVFDEPQKLRDVFKVGPDNVIITKTYEVPPRLQEFLPQQFESLRSDPYGPRINLDEIWSSDGTRLTLVAPAAAQEAFAKEFKLILVTDHGPKDDPAEDWPAGAIFQTPEDGEISQRAWKKLRVKFVPATSSELKEVDVDRGLKIVGGDSAPRDLVRPRPGINGPLILTKIRNAEVEDFRGLDRALHQLEAQPQPQVIVSGVQAVVKDGSETTSSFDFLVQYQADDQHLELKSGDLGVLELKNGTLSVAGARQARFPSLEEQKLADRAWKQLGLELEPIGEEDLARVKALDYGGGVKVTAVGGNPAGVNLDPDDILVGLHVWPTTSLATVGEVLSRGDLAELNPLKFYVVRASSGFGSRGEDRVVTGRISAGSLTRGVRGGSSRQSSHPPADRRMFDDLTLGPNGAAAGPPVRAQTSVEPAALEAEHGAATIHALTEQLAKLQQEQQLLVEMAENAAGTKQEAEFQAVVARDMKLRHARAMGAIMQGHVVAQEARKTPGLEGQVDEMLRAIEEYSRVSSDWQQLQPYGRELVEVAAKLQSHQQLARHELEADQQQRAADKEQRGADRQQRETHRQQREAEQQRLATDEELRQAERDLRQEEHDMQEAKLVLQEEYRKRDLERQGHKLDEPRLATDEELEQAERDLRQGEHDLREAKLALQEEYGKRGLARQAAGPVPVQVPLAAPVQVPAPVAVPLPRAPVPVSVPIAPAAPAAPDPMLKAPVRITAAADGTLQLAASNLPYVVHFEQGASRFKPDDNIKILEVRGTSEKFMPGHLYWIKGTYKLGSQDQAQLAVYTTAKNAAEANSHTWKTQWINVDRGNGSFELYLPMSHWGWPHVSFYPVHGGSSFGGTYFGTDDTVLKKWWEEGGVTDRTSKSATGERGGDGMLDDLFGPAPAQEDAKANWSAEDDLFGSAASSSAEPQTALPHGTEIRARRTLDGTLVFEAHPKGQPGGEPTLLPPTAEHKVGVSGAVGPQTEREVTATVTFHSNKPNLRYEGKTFEEWHNVLMNELSPKQRLEAIRAIAAFGASGYGEEAAGVILGVALQYDWSDQSNPTVRPLQEACVTALGSNLIGSDGSGVVAQRVPREAVLPMLIDLAEAAAHSENKNMKLFLTNMFPFYALDPRGGTEHQGFEALLKLTRDKDREVRLTALNRLLLLDVPEGAEYEEMREKQLQRIREEMADGDKPVSDGVLSKLVRFSYDSSGYPSPETRLTYVPELFPLLFSQHESTRSKVRYVLQYIQPDDIMPFVAQLEEVLDDDSRKADHIEAVRALSAMGAKAKIATDRLAKLLDSNDEQERIAAAAAIGRISQWDYATLVPKRLGTAVGVMTDDAGGMHVLPDEQSRQKWADFSSKVARESSDEVLFADFEGFGGGGRGGGGFF